MGAWRNGATEADDSTEAKEQTAFAESIGFEKGLPFYQPKGWGDNGRAARG